MKLNHYGRISNSLKKIGGVRRYFDGLLYNLPEVDKKIELELLLHPNINGKINFKDRIKIIKKNPFWLLKTNFDIFHTSYYTRYHDKTIPQIVTVYDMIHEKFPQYFPGIRNKIFLNRKKTTIESATAIICISKNTQNDLLKYYQVSKNKVTVIYPGLSSLFKKTINPQIKKQFFEKYKIKRPFLLYVGQRGRYKNFLGFLRIFTKWKKHKQFNLITVGGNNFLPNELIYFQKLHIGENLYNFQSLTDKDLISFYNYAHALILPSLYEGFGLPIIEAMACGCLVLASDKSCFPEIGKDCYISFNPENQNAILEGLNESFNTYKRQALIKKGLQRVKDFTWEKTAKQTLALYKRLHR